MCNCAYHHSSEYTGQGVDISDYTSEVQPTWCSGCGNYGIWMALKRALIKLQIAPHEVLLCFDVGCNGNMSDKIRGYRLHSLHGRVLPVAAAAKIANPKLKVIAFAGDGATYSEGINHFINSIRCNYQMTFLVHNNGTYGLTTGQASATTPQNAPREASPVGPDHSTLNPLELAAALNPSYLARGFSGNIEQLTDVIAHAIAYQDKGFAYVDILQSCPTYNKENDHYWYQQRVVQLSESSVQPFTTDLELAKSLVKGEANRIYSGLIYANEQLPTFMDRFPHRRDASLPWQQSTLVDEVRNHDASGLAARFK